MSNDPGSDPGQGAPGSQSGDPGSQSGGGAAAPMVINAEMLGEYKDDATLKSFDGKPVTDVFKWAANASKLIGGEKLVIPAGKLDTAENWNHVFDRLGRPKDASGYTFERPADHPEGLPYDEKLEGEFKTACHALGILPKQAQGIYALWNKYQGEAFKAIEADQAKRAEETETALMKELGTKEKYEEYKSGANAALNRFGGDPQTVAAFIDKFGNDPLVVKVFGNVARGMMEDAAIRGDKSFNLLGEDAPAMVKDIMANKENKLHAAYWDKSHPQHAHAVAEVSRLHEAIHGKKSVNMAG